MFFYMWSQSGQSLGGSLPQTVLMLL